MSIISKISNILKLYQKGFTLVEILIVIAILGLLVAITVPNMSSFTDSGTLNAASTELNNIKTAATAYYGSNNNEWPSDSTQLIPYLSGSPKATYSFDTINGFVIGVSNVSWSGITWSAPAGPTYTQDGKWIK
jgi:type IV pilus assembly protein PilA